MSKTFFRYFGLSLDRRAKEDLALGIMLINDEVVLVGIVINILKWNIGLWLHKRDYVVNCSANCI